MLTDDSGVGQGPLLLPLGHQSLFPVPSRGDLAVKESGGLRSGLSAVLAALELPVPASLGDGRPGDALKYEEGLKGTAVPL